MPIMSDTHILIGKELRKAAEECRLKGVVAVDLSAFVLNEINHPSVRAMWVEFAQLCTFTLDEGTRIMTVKWDPARRVSPRRHRPDQLTANLITRRFGA